jgi:hypothetical protein
MSTNFTRRAILTGGATVIIASPALARNILGNKPLANILFGAPSAPGATWTSAADYTTPLFTLVFSPSAGHQVQTQVSASSSFASVTYDDTHTLTASEIAAAAFAPLVGPLTPGPWYARFRWTKGGAWSAWSPTVSQTINTYLGLVDAYGTGILGYFGLRASSSSFTVGTNIVELRRASDNTTQTFGLQYDGRLDLADIIAFRDGNGASTVYVKNLYGQNISLTLTQATNSQQPEFVFDQHHAAWGAMKFVRANSQYLEGSSSGIVSAQPYHLYVLAKRSVTYPTSYAGLFALQSSASGSTEFARLGTNNTANTWSSYTGSGTGLNTAAFSNDDGAWGSWGVTFKSGSFAGDSNANSGSRVTGGSSSDTLVSGSVRLGFGVTGEYLDGHIFEAAVWGSDPANAGRSAIAQNSCDRLRYAY